MQLLLVASAAFFLLFAMNVKTKKLVNTQSGKRNSALIALQRVFSKKRGRGIKKSEGDSADVIKQNLKISEGKKFDLIVLNGLFAEYVEDPNGPGLWVMHISDHSMHANE